MPALTTSAGTQLAVALARDLEPRHDQREGRCRKHHAGGKAEHDVLAPGRDPHRREHRQGTGCGRETGEQAGEKAEPDQAAALQARDRERS